MSKTAILSAGAGLSIAAISNEIYVVNEESIVALSLLTIYWAVYNYAGPMYKQWSDSQADKFANILNSARADHTNAVKARISNVKDLSGVIDITKDLFAVSKVGSGGFTAPGGAVLTNANAGNRPARISSVPA